MTTVQASDIPERVSIIGSLGEPLNKVFTVRGKWIDNDDSKGPALLFHVTEIDGSPITGSPFDVEAIAEDSHGQSARRRCRRYLGLEIRMGRQGVSAAAQPWGRLGDERI